MTPQHRGLLKEKLAHQSVIAIQETCLLTRAVELLAAADGNGGRDTCNQLFVGPVGVRIADHANKRHQTLWGEVSFPVSIGGRRCRTVARCMVSGLSLPKSAAEPAMARRSRHGARKSARAEEGGGDSLTSVETSFLKWTRLDVPDCCVMAPARFFRPDDQGR